jgi:alkylation response protein AidB-like acyl-CoA dehydrogenase
MDVRMTDSIEMERQAFADLARDFSHKQLRANRVKNDCYPFTELFYGAIDNAASIGLYGINLAADYGGVEMNTSMLASIIEKISQVDASLAGTVFTNGAAIEILNSGSQSVGDTSIYRRIDELGVTPLAFCAYADPREQKLPTVDANQKYVSGSIDYLVLGNIANFAVIPVRDIDEKGISYYLIDLRTDAIEKSEPIVSLGLHACPAFDIALNRSPAWRVGKSGHGHQYFEITRQRMSICAAAISLGLMRGAFDDALNYTKERYQGGRQIIDWGQVRMMLANMAIETEIAESCLSMACQKIDRNQNGWQRAAQAAAIHIGEMATRCCTDGVQLFGGNGYTKDFPQEKRMRDSRHVQSLLGMLPLRKIDYIAQTITAELG